MNKKLLVLIFAILVLLMTACQPTPDKPPVVRKGDLEKKILETSNPSQRNEYPDSWVQDFKNDDGAVTIKIDAPLEIPDVSAYPVVEAVPAEITKDTIERLVNYFFDDKPVYDENEGESNSFLNKLIQQYKYDLKTLEESGKVHYTTHIFTAEEIPEEKVKIQGIISTNESRLSTAEDIQRDISDLGLVTNGDYSTCTLVDTASGDYTVKLYTSIGDSNYDIYIAYLKIYHLSYDDFEEPTGEKPHGMDMTLEEAESLAKETLADIGIEDAMRTDWFIGNYTGFSEEITGIDNSDQCYVFYFCQPVGGVPITYFYDYEGTSMFSEGYSYPWDPEVIEVYVNNHGVVGLTWSDADTLIEIINQDVKILPWEDIKEKAIQQFRMKEIGQYIVAGLTDEVSINIDRITLGMMRIAKKDTSREYMYVPVWDFFGNYDYQREVDSYSERACSMLTINAIDGSVLDRGLGY